jgi:hypothetical protein
VGILKKMLPSQARVNYFKSSSKAAQARLLFKSALKKAHLLNLGMRQIANYNGPLHVRIYQKTNVPIGGKIAIQIPSKKLAASNEVQSILLYQLPDLPRPG